MAAARASASLGRTVLRRASGQTRSQAWRQIGRRQYASAEHAKKSSDLPWLIGSVGFTVPAAVWLFGQGPTKSDHHGPAHAEKEAAEEEPSEETPEEESSGDDSEEKQSSEGDDAEQKDDSTEAKDDSKDDTKGDEEDDSKSEDKTDDSKDDSKTEDKDDKDDTESKEDSGESGKDKDGYELPGSNAPAQINWSSSKNNGKGPGEGQKVGTRKPTETKREKDSASTSSGASNPLLDDDEKSKKGEGLKDTMKIHGTVDSNRPLR